MKKGQKMSGESKLKISLAKKGTITWSKGKKFSKEHSRKKKSCGCKMER